ncbi:Endonuclease/exonuclease/phosphatase superfamily [Arabidopsis thaliana x Arabidopsis arenosa]|uniref:Endonuclease/exonuclease/phosphatase superfamily n=1 Tax=Arabidopsis thaliana x Arabidopsis arenosa TaxID=1240361 RepID=A0A8T1ZJN6_9BRAS|nr:Endonuclease/exonuclease/phosphatase superfamily [Arabidopsis thaliana x Arabidopsis arenosa]
MVEAVKALPLIPSLLGQSSTIHKVKKRIRSRSRSSGRGRSAPHVENIVVSQVDGSSVVRKDVTVDHRVIPAGTKDVVIPSLPFRRGQTRSEAPKSEEFSAADSSIVVKSSETIARSGFTLVGAGSHTKQKLFNVAANQKSRQLQIPYQHAGKVPGKGSSKNSKIFCWNIRGLNSHSRQRFVRSWIGVNKPLIGSILESHVSEDNAVSVLNSSFPGWRWDGNYASVDGGRILVVWDPSVSVICLKKSPQLMLCGVFCPATNESFSVAFVYAYNSVIQRRLLWEELSFISQHSPASFRPWLLLGDFNQIISADEHFSVIPHNLPLVGMAEFQDCLVSNDLFDLTSRGVFYTWSNGQPADPVLRKLDRALVNEEWINSFPDSFAIFDPPGDSDHSPCLVNTDASVERTKKSFKYFSFLSSHPKFKEIIALAWAKEVCVGSRLFTFGQRLKEVKVACRKLNREEHVARQKWNFFAKAQEIFYRQKSRVRWMADGDANTSYFFRVAASNYARNCIKVLRGIEGQRIENQDQIKDMTLSYFQNLLGTESLGVSPMDVEEIKGLMSFRCPSSLYPQLLAIPSSQEIKDTLFKMPKNKAPGPDGFPVEFYLEAWDIIGDDTVAAIKEFFTSGYLPRHFNATAIALIPKDTADDSLSQFRPVSCCTTLYKVIARIIKRRLKLFISDAVQLNQVGFVNGRLLCENVLLASELVNDFHIDGEVTRGCLQIDITKAYDSLNWDFLINVLKAIDLPDLFIRWIKECISTTSFSICFNGELLGFFPGKKGLRQGDPISSLLFVLAMDVLSKQLDAGAVRQDFIPHPLCQAPLITHLSFADDVLIFFDGAESSLEAVLNILDNFKGVSGLGLNKDKTALFLDGGNFQIVQDISARVGLQCGSFPVRYLGVPLTSKKLRKQDYQPLLDRISQRFQAWSVKMLSFAGRLQLIRTVIYSTITFWASIFLLPNQCLEEIEKMCSGFLWKGAPNSARGAKISWDSVCTPKESGGLGLRRLLAWNKVLCLKLIWLIFAAGGSLWVSWIRLHLIGSSSFWELDSSVAGSWIWRNICKLRHLARPFVFCEIGPGITCSFWKDDWTSLGPLIEITGVSGPRISGLPEDSVVVDAIRDGEWWLSRSRSRNSTISLLKQCLPSADIIDPSREDDKFLWKIGDSPPSSKFSASSTWHFLNPPGPAVFWHESVWFKGAIPKHAFITWVVARQRLHTRDRLIRWGLNVPSSCLLCNSFDETLQHLFFDCVFSNEFPATLISGETIYSSAVFIEAMPKRTAEARPSSTEIQRNKPDTFGNYRSQVAELLSQGERISHHDQQQQANERHSESVIGDGMSNLEKENLNVLLRQCVRNLTPEVDEMQECVCSLYLISQLGNNCQSSSPSNLVPEESGRAREDDIQLLLRSDPDMVKNITSQYSNVLLSKLDNMQQELEKLLDDVVATCRPMSRGEIRELQKSIKELPERNLNRVADIVGSHYITSGKDFNDKVIVNLDQADNIMLWRLHFYVGAVKSAQKLAP